jgi:hypothetical protein
VRATFGYLRTLFSKFFMGMILGIAITPCFQLLSWFMIKHILKKKGGRQ